MKNKITILSIGLLGLAVAGFSGLMTIQLANYGKEIMASVLDRTTATRPTYGDPWRENYKISECTLYKEKVRGIGASEKRTLTKIKSLDCLNIKQEMTGQADGKYLVETVYNNFQTYIFGLIKKPDLAVLTPVKIKAGVYQCNYQAEGWKTVITAMPFGRLGYSSGAISMEPNASEYRTGTDTTLIIEELKGEVIMPYDFYTCPTNARMAATNAGDIVINKGFISLKNMNTLVVQPNAINYRYGVENQTPLKGTYYINFPEIYKDFQLVIERN